MFYQIYDFITIEELLHFNVRLDLFVYDKKKFYLKITFKNFKQKELITLRRFQEIQQRIKISFIYLNNFDCHINYFYIIDMTIKEENLIWECIN